MRAWPWPCSVSSVASFVAFKYILASQIPRELVGSWQVTEGSLKGATLELRRDGTALAIVYRQGKKETTRSSIKVEGKTIFLATRDAIAGTDDTSMHTIVELTDDELVLRDEDQSTYRMTRLRQ